MHNSDRLIDIRNLDDLLFGGVPAVPDPMYGRGDYTYHASIRHTRSSANELEAESIDPDSKIAGYLEYDLNTWEMVCIDVSEEEEKKR